MRRAVMTQDQLLQIFSNRTDQDYLRAHAQRFLRTRAILNQGWHESEAAILDIGAHWLHQAALFSADGHQVTAANLATMSEHPEVKSLAHEHNISLISYTNLSDSNCLSHVPDSSVDLVLFCEIIEHITFNPLEMWREIYRVLKPQGRVVVTTPNFYALKSIMTTVVRLLTGRGTGIEVRDILERHTFSPHWKEFSTQELRSYFQALSPDFMVRRCVTFNHIGVVPGAGWLRRALAALRNGLQWPRQSIFLEVELSNKVHGITPRLHW